MTNGLGAGSDPAIGRLAALEDTERIIEVLEGADMVFVTAGMGGGTGTGAAPVVAALAKELNALTVAVVTKPFGFEGPRRMKQADKGLADLASSVDTVISIPNDKLLNLVPKGTSFYQAFRVADDVLRQAVQGIAEIITTPGIINRDFSDIRSIMLGMGFAMMGTATARGENALVEAATRRSTARCSKREALKVLAASLSTSPVRASLAFTMSTKRAPSLRSRGVRRRADQLRHRSGRSARGRGEDHSDCDGIPASRTSCYTAGKHVRTGAGTSDRAAIHIGSRPPAPAGRRTRGDHERLGFDRGRVALSEEAAAVAASPEILPSSSSPCHDENKNDLDLPAFIRRERRLFQ